MKTKVLGVLFAFALGFLMWNMDSLKAMAEEYRYEDKSVQTENGTEVVKQWYSGTWDNKVEVDGPPAYENMEGSHIYINAEPDEEAANWLKGLHGGIGWFDITIEVPQDVTVQIGTPENKLSNFNFSVFRGTANIYGDASWGMLYRDYQGIPHLNLYGNIEELKLGAEDNMWELGPIQGSAYIDGNITRQVTWIKTYESKEGYEENPRYYKGYIGSITVNGTVAGGKIRETVWDAGFGSDIWYDSYVIEGCEAGVFKIENGVLAEEVPVTVQEPEVREYVIRYWINTWSDAEGSPRTVWNREIYYKDTFELVTYQNDIDPKTVPDDCYITIVGLGEPLVLEKNIAYLEISNSGQHCPKDAVIDVTVKGNVSEMMLDIYRYNDITVNVDGQVDYATINYRYNKGANVNVSGKIASAVHNAIFPTGTLTVGKFSVKNMPMIINGIWNPALLFYTLKDEGAIAYAPINHENVTTALEDDTLDKEFTISTPDGEKTLVKEATVLVEQTNENILNEVMQREEMTAAMSELEQKLASIYTNINSMESVCGVDISMGTHYMDVKSGNSYVGDSNYAAEEITELEEGNELPFTVKIPEGIYDKNKHYSVIREHKNQDGSVQMDVLEATIEGDKITFKSDKFSTFMIIASEVEGKEEPEPTPEPTPTPAPTPTSTPTLAETNRYPVPNTILRSGSTQRDAVRWLQTELSQAGYQLEIDGLFGKNTRAALMDYQLRHGLQVDGICGKMTINALLNDDANITGNKTNTNPVPGSIMRVGHKNRLEVCWLQTELVRAGYQLKIDGLFGNRTRATLMDYQLRHGLKVDGVCGPQTIQSMIAR